MFDGAIQILNSELAEVLEWFDSNKLTLNVNDTQKKRKTRKKNLNPQGDVILCNEAMQCVMKAKFLGVIVDQHLNWKDHILMVSHKISKSCGIISRIRNTLDLKSKKNDLLSFLSYLCIVIVSYLTYCIDVWSSTYRTNLKTLCTAQKRSVLTSIILETMVHTLFATAQQPHSRYIFTNQKILPLDKLINQKIRYTFLQGNQYHLPAERLSQ